jgi:hypothetical protein
MPSILSEDRGEVADVGGPFLSSEVESASARDCIADFDPPGDHRVSHAGRLPRFAAPLARLCDRLSLNFLKIIGIKRAKG